MLNRRSFGLALVAALLTVVYFSPTAQAQTASATGTWKWTQQGFGGRRGGGGGGGGGAGGAGGGGQAPATQPGGGAGGGRRGGRGGTPIEITATLKQDGEKLSGKVAGMTPQTPDAPAVDIKDGSVKADGSIEFKVTVTGARGEITRSYKGKIEGDSIKGTTTFEFAGAPAGGGGGGGFTPQPLEWTATRSK
ncbi:MAG TPA: hypothetical protein VHD56_00115 [Tepidisphaeraceae bacterium]|nr:hypothetical protein [Tepidisphaeraceae bacterium]